jgi:hypothetical protein
MAPQVTLPVARTRDEAHLYMDMHPCERCGDVNVTWDSSLTDDNGTPARRYHGTCGDCGAQRAFVFALPERPLVAGADEVVVFGGPDPSRLLDPGEWLLVADLCAQAAAVPDGAIPGADERQSIAIAVAAVGEILKFVPAGADAVPESAFWSTRGRTVFLQEPGRFQRRRLLIVRDTYRDAQEQMTVR